MLRDRITKGLGTDSYLALLGDVVVTRQARQCDDLNGLLHGSVYTIANLEMSFNSVPQARKGMIDFRLPPEATTELHRLGINAVGVANNHTFDYGPAALLESLRALHLSGINCTGGGRNLSEAVLPSLLPSPQGTIAHLQFYCAVPVVEEWKGWPEPPSAPTYFVERRDPDQPCLATVRAYHVLVRDAARRVERILAPVEDDVNALVESVKLARSSAAVVIVHLHYHWLPEFRTEFHDGQRILAHRCLDAGADLVVGSGPHVFQAIERHGERFVFHSIGNYIFQALNSAHLTEHWHRQGVGKKLPREDGVVVVGLEHGKLGRMAVVPIVTSGTDGSDPNFGDPALAPPAQARAILERIKRESAALGAELRIAEDIGWLEPPGA